MPVVATANVEARKILKDYETLPRTIALLLPPMLILFGVVFAFQEVHVVAKIIAILWMIGGTAFSFLLVFVRIPRQWSCLIENMRIDTNHVEFKSFDYTPRLINNPLRGEHVILQRSELKVSEIFTPMFGSKESLVLTSNGKRFLLVSTFFDEYKVLKQHLS
jgi:hypothetical protein